MNTSLHQGLQKELHLFLPTFIHLKTISKFRKAMSKLICPGQFGCGILKMVGPKMQDFCPKKEIVLKQSTSKSAKIVHSKSIFYVKNQQNFLKKNFV